MQRNQAIQQPFLGRETGPGGHKKIVGCWVGSPRHQLCQAPKGPPACCEPAGAFQQCGMRRRICGFGGAQHRHGQPLGMALFSRRTEAGDLLLFASVMELADLPSTVEWAPGRQPPQGRHVLGGRASGWCAASGLTKPRIRAPCQAVSSAGIVIAHSITRSYTLSGAAHGEPATAPTVVAGSAGCRSPSAAPALWAASVALAPRAFPAIVASSPVRQASTQLGPVPLLHTGSHGIAHTPAWWRRTSGVCHCGRLHSGHFLHGRYAMRDRVFTLHRAMTTTLGNLGGGA